MICVKAVNGGASAIKADIFISLSNMRKDEYNKRGYISLKPRYVCSQEYSQTVRQSDSTAFVSM
jgi:hypothetical protein